MCEDLSGLIKMLKCFCIFVFLTFLVFLFVSLQESTQSEETFTNTYTEAF